ncbi:DUF3179 domain-containing (seleno)protein [Patescibacteria group bacterium]
MNKFIYPLLLVIVVGALAFVFIFNKDVEPSSINAPVSAVHIDAWNVTPKGGVNLGGYGSFDPDGGDIVSYEWKIINTPPAQTSRKGEIVYSGSTFPEVNIPMTNQDVGTWTFEFTLIDGDGEKNQQKVQVFVREEISALTSVSLSQASDAVDIVDSEIIAGLIVNNEAAAFPRSVMDEHAIANIVVGGEPVVLVLCEFCQTGVAYYRVVEQQQLTFNGFGGTLIEDNYQAQDAETLSTWSIVSGEAVEGQLTGTKLSSFSVNMMTWEEWRTLHPESLILLK